MLLKFHTKPGYSTPWPNSHHGGQARRLIGRTYDAATRTYPARAEPDQVDSEDPDASHMARKCSRGELYAADESTAKFCGVEFVALQRGEDGEWFPKKQPAPKPSASKD